jgi:hypothetical protein
MASASKPNQVTNIKRILRFCKKWGKIFGGKSNPEGLFCARRSLNRLFAGIYLAETQLVQG